jgi:hypothetical protein
VPLPPGPVPEELGDPRADECELPEEPELLWGEPEAVLTAFGAVPFELALLTTVAEVTTNCAERLCPPPVAVNRYVPGTVEAGTVTLLVKDPLEPVRAEPSCVPPGFRVIVTFTYVS